MDDSHKLPLSGERQIDSFRGLLTKEFQSFVDETCLAIDRIMPDVVVGWYASSGGFVGCSSKAKIFLYSSQLEAMISILTFSAKNIHTSNGQWNMLRRSRLFPRNGYKNPKLVPSTPHILFNSVDTRFFYPDVESLKLSKQTNFSIVPFWV